MHFVPLHKSLVLQFFCSSEKIFKLCIITNTVKHYTFIPVLGTHFQGHDIVWKHKKVIFFQCWIWESNGAFRSSSSGTTDSEVLVFGKKSIKIGQRFCRLQYWIYLIFFLSSAHALVNVLMYFVICMFACYHGAYFSVQGKVWNKNAPNHWS